MAEVMNAAGFCSTKWIGYCHTKEQRQFEQLRVDEDVWEETIKDTLKRMYTRNLPVITGLYILYFLCRIG